MEWTYPQIQDDIKLVALDMDGTLLDSQKRLPPDFFDAVHALRAKGVRCCIASGRQYYALLRDLEPVADDLLFLAENGSIIFDGRRNIFTQDLPYSLYRPVVEHIRQVDDCQIVLCGARAAYIEQQDPAYLHQIDLYYARRQLREDLLAPPVEDAVCKLAVYCDRHAEQRVLPLLEEYRDRFLVSLAGSDWVDMMLPGTNKGSGLTRLQQYLGIGPDNCMAFGDYLNDLQMMGACTHSVAMHNAHPQLAAVCRHRAPSNDQDGVMRVMRHQFDL